MTKKVNEIGKLGSKYWRLWSASAISNLGDGITSVAYPWLASAVTRSPLLIAIVGFASRLPWLVFTLFAGVISDRFDRRKIILRMDLVRGFLTVIVALVVMWKQSELPKLNDLAGGLTVDTNYFIYAVLEQRGYVGFSDSIEVEHLTTPLEWEAMGLEQGAPFASAHTFFQTGPFRPGNIAKGFENVLFAIIVTGKPLRQREKKLAMAT